MKQLRMTTCGAGLAELIGLPAVSEEEVIAKGGPITEVEDTEIKRESASFDHILGRVVPSRRMMFIDGNPQQCELPEDEQDILLILPEGKTIQLIATPDPEDDNNYLLGFKDKTEAQIVESTLTAVDAELQEDE